MKFLRMFVRLAPLYQQYPRRQVSDAVWQRTATFVYALKMQLVYGGKIKSRLTKLKELEGKSKGKGVLIIANGPSANDLTHMQIKKLMENGFEFIVMNDFYKNIHLSNKISPSFYCLGDPDYVTAAEEHSNLRQFLSEKPSCVEVRPADIDEKSLFSNNVLFYNSIPGAGFARRFSPLFWRAYPDGILFVALCLANFLGFSTIYVIGADNSMYLNHYLDEEMKIKCRQVNLHSYKDSAIESETIPFITRNMSDVLFAHARFLDDLRRFCSHFAINVAQSDKTNDAFPRACLLPKGNINLDKYKHPQELSLNT